MSKHLQAPTSNSNFQKQILLFNSDFRKQTPFSNSDFQKQTPLFKLPGRKQTPIFIKNKHRLFKSNSDVPLSFRKYTRLGEIREYWTLYTGPFQRLLVNEHVNLVVL